MTTLKKKLQEGFSLVELVMVMVILGILASVAVPKMTNVLSQASERAEKSTVDQMWAGCESYANDKLIEQGTETWPNGYIYKGEFKNSVWSGQGILTFPDGSKYEGNWENGFMNGEGKFTLPDGTEKVGVWKNGELQK